LIGWSSGGGMTEIISNRLHNDSLPPFSGVVMSETIDGIKHGTRGLPMTAAPAAIWSGFANNYYTDKIIPGMPSTMHGQSFPSATNFGPLSRLDHGMIGVDPLVLSAVKHDVEQIYDELP